MPGRIGSLGVCWMPGYIGSLGGHVRCLDLCVGCLGLLDLWVEVLDAWVYWISGCTDASLCKCGRTMAIYRSTLLCLCTSEDKVYTTHCHASKSHGKYHYIEQKHITVVSCGL